MGKCLQYGSPTLYTATGINLIMDHLYCDVGEQVLAAPS
jgi:hypothetical protein